MSYPRRRNQYPTTWHLRPGARLDDALPARTAARTLAIRRVFVEELDGHASILDVGNRADELGLLNAFSTHRSAYEALMVALRPIASPDGRGSLVHLAQVSPQSAQG